MRNIGLIDIPPVAYNTTSMNTIKTDLLLRLEYISFEFFPQVFIKHQLM